MAGEVRKPLQVCVLFIYIFQSCWSDSVVKILNDDSFEHLTQASTGATTGDWLIVFSFTEKDPVCEDCKKADEALEKTYEKLGHVINCAFVLPPRSTLTLKRFDIPKWPTVILLRQGKQYIYSKETFDADSFIKFVEEGYKMTVSLDVPPPISKFEVFIDDVMGDVKHIIQIRKNAAFVIFFAGILFGLMLTPLLRLLADCLVNSFLQEPETSEQNLEDEGLGKDEVDEGEEEEKKER